MSPTACPEISTTAVFDGVTGAQYQFSPLLARRYPRPTTDVKLVTFRDPDASTEELQRHGWLAEFLSAEPRRLAEFGYEVNPDRLDGTSGSGSTVRRIRSAGCGDSGSDSTDGAPSITRAALGDGTVVQPDGVDMEADGLVDPDPSRSFADVGGMSELL